MLRLGVILELVGEGMIKATGELECSSTYIHLKEYDKSKDKAEKGRRFEATDISAMGMAILWYRKRGTSMESSISCSHRGRALVMKGVEEVENAEANSKYQDKAEGQRPENFTRLVSMGFSSR
ncbi:hypothetical protein BHE74_00058498 [Ensete ventricosum]|nr:hypothetical protein BHE74_00058498 [Ensete ventricosum]